MAGGYSHPTGETDVSTAASDGGAALQCQDDADDAERAAAAGGSEPGDGDSQLAGRHGGLQGTQHLGEEGAGLL